MGELTEFQKRRAENIKRNNDLLKKLNLSTVSIETTEKKKQPVRKVVSKVIKKEPVQPTRRSRRIAGVKLEPEEEVKLEPEPVIVKNERIYGDITLSDLVGDDLSKFANRNFSAGDFFNKVKEEDAKPELKEMRDQFDLELFPTWEPNEIRLCDERITSMFFHPTTDKRLVIGGDTSGLVGFWNVDEGTSEDIPDISRFKLHSKNVIRCDVLPNDASTIFTASYDGIMRTINLNNMKSVQLLEMKDYDGDTLGVSDVKIHDSVAYMTTLSGEFQLWDMRSPYKPENILRLADKKIGSMDVHPTSTNLIATGSLDRTMKLWDIRATPVKQPEWSQYDDYPSVPIVAQYDSRLSISSVSFSPSDNKLVCNGYDDTICIFDVNSLLNRKKAAKDYVELEPQHTIKHNCQSGRWTSILKAKFKPNKNVFAIANMKRAIDIYSSDGEMLAHLETKTVPAVASFHATRDWIVGGNSSGKVFMFT